MWDWIHSYWSAHSKTILTVAFACGLLSLVIKLIDEWVVSKESKDRFNEWIDAVAIRLDDLRYDNLLHWAKNHKVWYACFCIITSTGIGALHLTYRLDTTVRTETITPPSEADLIATIMLSALGSLVPFVIMLKDKTAMIPWRVLCRVIPLGAAVICLCMGIGKGFGNVDWPRAIFYSTALVMSYQVIFFMPLFIISIIRVPLLMLTRGVWWLANYQKGAWAAFIALLTMALGIFRLFL